MMKVLKSAEQEERERLARWPKIKPTHKDDYERDLSESNLLNIEEKIKYNKRIAQEKLDS